MSFKLVARVLAHSTASGTNKVVLAAIAHHVRGTNSWPGLERLASFANVSERSVRRALRELEESGELVTRERPGTSNEYVIRVNCPPTCDGSDNHLPRAVANTPDADVRTTPDADVRAPRTQMSAEHVTEHVENSLENVTYLNVRARDLDAEWDAALRSAP